MLTHNRIKRSSSSRRTERKNQGMRSTNEVISCHFVLLLIWNYIAQQTISRLFFFLHTCTQQVSFIAKKQYKFLMLLPLQPTSNHPPTHLGPLSAVSSAAPLPLSFRGGGDDDLKSSPHSATREEEEEGAAQAAALEWKKVNGSIPWQWMDDGRRRPFTCGQEDLLPL